MHSVLGEYLSKQDVDSLIKVSFQASAMIPEKESRKYSWMAETPQDRMSPP